MQNTKQLSGNRAAGVVICIMAISFVSTWFCLNRDMITLFADGISRLMIAKQVVSGIHPGFAQMGTWWPPLPHLAMVPFVINDNLYQTALAGSVVSMFAYIVAAVYLYKIVLFITGDWIAAGIAVVAFSGPNILFMQSTPMSEMTYISAYIVSVYYLIRWAHDPDHWWHLIPASFGATVAVMTRYESLALIAASTALIIIVLVLKRSKVSKIEALTLFYLYLPVMAVILWLAYNRIIFGDILYFVRGEFAASGWGQQVTMALKPQERAAGNLPFSFLVYWRTVIDNSGWAVAVIAVFGIIALLISRLSISVKLAILLLMAPLFVYPVGMFQGGWIVVDHPDYMSGNILNLRFGTFALAGIAFGVAYLASKIKFLRAPILIITLMTFGLMISNGGVSTVIEASANQSNADAAVQRDVGAWLKLHWDGGTMLRQRVGNELVAFTSDVPFGKVIYEGDRDLWTGSLKNPAQNDVKWIFMRSGSIKDDVHDSLMGSQVLAENYRLVYDNGGAQVYVRKSGDNTATAAAALPAALSYKQPLAHPTISVDVADKTFAGAAGNSCWPGDIPMCNITNDLALPEAINVSEGTVLTFNVSSSAAPTQLQGTLLDDNGANGDPVKIDLLSAHDTFKISGLTPGLHRLQVDALYVDDLPTDQPFVQRVFLLDVT